MHTSRNIYKRPLTIEHDFDLPRYGRRAVGVLRPAGEPGAEVRPLQAPDAEAVDDQARSRNLVGGVEQDAVLPPRHLGRGHACMNEGEKGYFFL